MWNGLIKYWALSGDDSVVPTITEALLFQVGPDQNYMPPNQSKSLGNDDQAAWGLAAMSAAEYGFPNPSNESITWAGLADAVFQSQVLRWDETSCGGVSPYQPSTRSDHEPMLPATQNSRSTNAEANLAQGLKWQIFTFNNGYNYKNSVSQGSLAQLAARLGRYTGNSNYSDWATRVVEWTRSVGLISNTGSVYDGTDDNLNCTELNHIQWTLNSGMFITAGAYSANAVSFMSITR
jgi:mannan endo-1,6-alpha-mannosidase